MKLNNEYDKTMIKDTKEYLNKISLSKDDIWLDAGSHIGSFTLLIYDKVKKVISIEASKQNFKLLSQNIKTYRTKNIKIFNQAIIENNDKIRDFYINQYKNKGLHSLLVKKGRKKEKVECVNINKIIQKFKINKIKMDIEGMEYEILKSISDKNYNQISELIVEFHLKILSDNKGKKYKEITKLLKQKFKKVQYSKNLSWTQVIHCKK